jgi:hypothetical protein
MNAFPYGSAVAKAPSPNAIRAANENEVMQDQLEAMQEHARAGDRCGCRSEDVHASTCDRFTWIRALLLEPFSSDARRK